MNQEQIARASLRLKAHLFGAGHRLDAPGFVGIAPPETIHVYLHCSRRKWRGEHPMEWEGVRVHWHYNVGPIVAQFDRVLAVGDPAPAKEG